MKKLPVRKPLPENLVERIQHTRKWPRERAERFIFLWNSQKRMSEISQDLGIKEGLIRSRLYLMRIQGGLSTEVEECTRQVSLKKFAGMRKCINCRNDFYSPHIRNIQRCTLCKRREESGDVEDYVLRLPTQHSRYVQR